MSVIREHNVASRLCRMLSGLGLRVLKQPHLQLVTVLICAMRSVITVSESNLHGPFKVQLSAEWNSFVHKIVSLRNGQKGPWLSPQWFGGSIWQFLQTSNVPYWKKCGGSQSSDNARGQEMTLAAYTDQKTVCHYRLNVCFYLSMTCKCINILHNDQSLCHWEMFLFSMFLFFFVQRGVVTNKNSFGKKIEARTNWPKITPQGLLILHKSNRDMNVKRGWQKFRKAVIHGLVIQCIVPVQEVEFIPMLTLC